MRYAYDSVTVIKCAASIGAADVDRIFRAVRLGSVKLPESCFLNQMRSAADEALARGDDGAMIPVPPDFRWCGGNSYYLLGGHSDPAIGKFFESHVAPKIVGHIEVILHFADGSSFTGLRVTDGAVSFHRVMARLSDAAPSDPGCVYGLLTEAT